MTREPAKLFVTTDQPVKRFYDLENDTGVDWYAWLRISTIENRNFYVKVQIGFQATRGEAEAFIEHCLGNVDLRGLEAGLKLDNETFVDKALKR
jgi:hypothetical protein